MTTRTVAPPTPLPVGIPTGARAVVATAPHASAPPAGVGTVAAAATAAAPTVTPHQVVLAGRSLRICRCLLDAAVLLSPAVPLSMVAIALRINAIGYVVVPVAVLSAWIWMQLWQGLTGKTFGNVVLGLRTIRAADLAAPTFGACLTRSVLFAATAGLAAWPVAATPLACRGRHDEHTGLAAIDVTVGANPLGPRQQPALRRTIDRSLRSVASPVPLAPTHPGTAYARTHGGRP